MDQASDVVRQREGGGDDVEYGGREDEDLDDGQRRAQRVGEASKRQIRLTVVHQRRRCAHQHDDRRLDDDGERKRHAERGKVDGGRLEPAMIAARNGPSTAIMSHVPARGSQNQPICL